MPFSSLKKSSKRSQRHYKERQQPTRRAHLGQLEKHKDYVVRAKDYQRKATALKSLRQRAREKNPDEFYFHMSRSRLVDGKHTDIAPTAADKPTGPSSGSAQSSAENKRIRQMLLEDSNYLRHKLQIERAQLAKLEASLAFVGGPQSSLATAAAAGCRTVFDRADFRRLNRRREDPVNDDDDCVVADIDGPRWAAHLASLDKADVTRLAKERLRALKAARQRVARAEAIAGALAKLETKRNLAAEVGRPRKLIAEATDDRPAVWKFAFKRKR